MTTTIPNPAMDLSSDQFNEHIPIGTEVFYFSHPEADGLHRPDFSLVRPSANVSAPHFQRGVDIPPTFVAIRGHWDVATSHKGQQR